MKLTLAAVAALSLAGCATLGLEEFDISTLSVAELEQKALLAASTLAELEAALEIARSDETQERIAEIEAEILARIEEFVE